MVAEFDHGLFPFESCYFDRGDAIRLHYVDEGQGPPVVMVHGNPTWSFYYRNLISALRASHRCLALDHVGMGLSDKPKLGQLYAYTLAERVADFSAWLDSLRLAAPIVLVVHDWGGMIGLAWATQQPERIAKLVILNTSGFPLPDDTPFPWPLALTRTSLGALLVQGFNAFSWVATIVAMTRTQMDENVRDAYTAPYDSWANRIATLRFVQDIPLLATDASMAIVQTTAENLHRLADKPTVIAWGGRDFVFNDAFLGQFCRLLPNAAVHYFADAGHYVLEDVAAEVVPLIVDFVREDDSANG